MKIEEHQLLTQLTESIRETVEKVLSEQRRRYWTDSSNPLAWEYFQEYSPAYVFRQFQENPNQNNMWGPLINPQEYAKALDEFVQFGKLVRFPAQRVYQWMGLCLKNIALLNSCTQIYGHTQWYPFDDFFDVFFNYNEEGEWETYCQENDIDPDDGYYDYLETIGFWQWVENGSDTTPCTDYGLDPLMELAVQYQEDMSPEQTLVLVNRIIDVTHMNGDLSSLFMKGGKRACDAISNGRGKLPTNKIYGMC